MIKDWFKKHFGRKPVHLSPRELWVAALRSGKYKHGRGELHPTFDASGNLSDNAFCCLGVLCEVAMEAGVITSYHRHDGVTPNKVQLWVGLATEIGRFYDESKNTGSNSLAVINDSASFNPFERIAGIIESEPEGLFVN